MISQFKVNKIYEALDNVHKPDGLYYDSISQKTGEWCSSRLKIDILYFTF